MGTDTLTRWELSAEYHMALEYWTEQIKDIHYEIPFEQSQFYRDARLAFRKRVNGGYSKGSH